MHIISVGSERRRMSLFQGFTIRAAPINRSFSVGIIQLFQKEVLKQSMSFIFYINNGFTTVATLQQFQGYYQNLGSFYSTGDDLLASSNYHQTWTQSQAFTQCDTLPQNFSQGIKETIQNPILKQKSHKLKPKRRMEKTVQKQILSAKKNSQSNIINQFYSFFSNRQKSQKIVQKCALLMGKSAEQVQKIVSTFFTVMHFINAKRGRKYVNSTMFLKFFNPEEFGEYLSEMKDKIDRLEGLSMEQLCQIIRRCIKYFLKEASINAILTSKRISVVSKQEHLKKRRKIFTAVVGN